MKWVIDTSKDDNSNDKLVEALKDNNCEYQLFNYKPFMNYQDIIEEIKFDKTEKIMCYGTINFISKIQKCKELNPGSYCNFDAFKCSSYYPFLKKSLLNGQGKIIEWKDVESLLMNATGSYFIRPNSGKKLFTGVVTDYDSFQTDIGFAVSKLEPQTKVLVSPYVFIEKEWRFFVSSILDGHVITGSLYHENGKHVEEECKDEYASLLALLTSKLYNPDPVYVIDICKTAVGEYKVLELNSFSCSGLYKCDVNEIVKYIEEIEENKNGLG